MYAQVEKPKENKGRAVVNTVGQKKNGSETTFQFVDNRPEAIAQRKLQGIVTNSPQARQAVQLQAIADNYSAQPQKTIQKKENNMGLPDNLKSGIDNLSGYSMDDVKVHYNSDKPAQLQAHAYAQGTDIHLASGQEKHLPHEAWHVVQQKQGRVKPTMQMKGKVNVNDDAGLEKEADVMGTKALQFTSENNSSINRINQNSNNDLIQLNKTGVIQFAIDAVGLQRIRDFQPIPNTEVIVEDGNQTKFTIVNLNANNATLHDNGNQQNVTIANLQDNYTLIHVDTPQVRLEQADLHDQSNHNQARNNSQVIDLSAHPMAFAHYSYDLLRDGQNSNKRHNDHLTIENALTELLLSSKKEDSDLQRWFIDNKSDMNKADINQLLQHNFGIAEMDNMNFRPNVGQQNARAIPVLIDPNNTLRTDNSRDQNAAAPVPVDNQLTLLHFINYVEAALAKNNVPQPIIDQFRQTIVDQGTNRMGFPLNQLFINAGQIKDMVRFAIIIRNIVGMNWLRDPIPAPLFGYAKHPPKVTIDEVSFQQLNNALQQGVNNDAYQAIYQTVQQDGIWVAQSGQPNYASVSQFLAKHYWPTIRNWILNP